jgi:hypothetical protein
MEDVMPLRKRVLLPPLDDEGLKAAMCDLLLKYHRRCKRKGWETTGFLETVYPHDRGWVDQPGNKDPKRRVHYLRIHTWRLE